MIRMIQITSQASPYWDSLVAVYQESFPIDEQRPIGDIVRLLSADTRYTVYALLDTEEFLVGLLTTWHFSEFIYIEHFALSPVFRSQGYGTETLTAFIRLQSKPILLEVEPPTDETSQQRIRFYKRCGFTLYDYPYIQPPYTPQGKSVHLCLMGTFDTAVISLAHVSKILYKEVYGCILRSNNTEQYLRSFINTKRSG